MSGRITVEADIIATRIKHDRDAFKAIDPAFDAIRTERAAGYRWVDA